MTTDERVSFTGRGIVLWCDATTSLLASLLSEGVVQQVNPLGSSTVNCWHSVLIPGAYIQRIDDSDQRCQLALPTIQPFALQ